jgi:hypothetical protein
MHRNASSPERELVVNRVVDEDGTANYDRQSGKQKHTQRIANQESTQFVLATGEPFSTFQKSGLTGYLAAADRKNLYLGASGFFALGCAAQMCEANSLSRSIAYRCFISSIDLPTSGPGLLKTHAQTEQARPQNRSCSTHTISRCWDKGHLRHERIAEGHQWR